MKGYGGGVNEGVGEVRREGKRGLREYSLECEYSELRGIEGLVGECEGKIMKSDYEGLVVVGVGVGGGKVGEFWGKVGDFRGG